MIDASTLLVFAAACLALTMTPGPDMLLIASRSISQGKAAGFASLAGIQLGTYAHAIAAALGLTQLIAAFPSAYEIIRYAGAAYLLFLAWQAFRSQALGAQPTSDPGLYSSPEILRQGLLTNILNPKMALFVLALFPQFTKLDAGPVLFQFLLLATVLAQFGSFSWLAELATHFRIQYVGVALPTERAWTVSAAGGRSLTLDSDRLAEAFEAARRTLEFDAYARTYAGHRSETIDGATVRLVPLRVGTRPVGMLAVSGRPVEPGTLDTLAGVVAIAVERMRFLADRQAAELTRQSEELKTALLASLGHDLRTPLTAIRVAASNLKAEWLDTSDRQEQSALILEEVDRLTRLFANILEMARLDAGAVERTPRWTHPSEIVTAARYQVAHGLSHHVVKVTIDEDRPVQLDAALTASALAQLLQNAAQYAPFDTPIEVTVSARDSTLHLRVRDHGPGIDPADLPHLFERFYRGTGASQLRASGSGLGLWIARGLLSAEGGRVWAENCPDGGAAFTITVPIHALQSTPLEAS